VRCGRLRNHAQRMMVDVVELYPVGHVHALLDALRDTASAAMMEQPGRILK
jgi:hypothetical protein